MTHHKDSPSKELSLAHSSFKAILVNPPRLLQAQISKVLNDLEIPMVGKTSGRAQTLEAIAETQANIIILDMILPDSNATQLITKYHSSSPKKFFLVISAIESRHIINQALKSGIFDFLAKPLNSERLAQSLLKVQQWKEPSET